MVVTRPEFHRRAGGKASGPGVVERTTWSGGLDPSSPSRMPEAMDHDFAWIVPSDEGLSSSLEAACLRTLTWGFNEDPSGRRDTVFQVSAGGVQEAHRGNGTAACSRDDEMR